MTMLYLQIPAGLSRNWTALAKEKKIESKLHQKLQAGAQEKNSNMVQTKLQHLHNSHPKKAY